MHFVPCLDNVIRFQFLAVFSLEWMPCILKQLLAIEVEALLNVSSLTVELGVSSKDVIVIDNATIVLQVVNAAVYQRPHFLLL